MFTDAGMIRDAGLQPELESFRYSVGVGVAWNSPVGPLKFSYGYPLNKKTRRPHPAFPVPGGYGILVAEWA